MTCRLTTLVRSTSCPPNERWDTMEEVIPLYSRKCGKSQDGQTEVWVYVDDGRVETSIVCLDTVRSISKFLLCSKYVTGYFAYVLDHPDCSYICPLIGGCTSNLRNRKPSLTVREKQYYVNWFEPSILLRIPSVTLFHTLFDLLIHFYTQTYCTTYTRRHSVSTDSRT